MVRYLHPVYPQPARIEKVGEDFANELVFKIITFPAKIRDIYRILKKNCVFINDYFKINGKHMIKMS